MKIRSSAKLLLLLAVSSLLLLFVACGDENSLEEKQLAAPAGVRISAAEVVSWDAVDGADHYTVQVGETKFVTDATELDLYRFTNRAATYLIKVKAHGANRVDSVWSNTRVMVVKDYTGRFYATENADGSVTLRALDKAGLAGKVIIPDMFDGKRVSAVEYFDNCNAMTSLVVSNGIKIKNSAFASCAQLARVTMPADLTEIPQTAFYACPMLTEVNIPDSVTKIGDGAFAESGLTSLTVPAGVTSFGSAVFGCDDLRELNVESGNPVYRSENNCVIKTDENMLVSVCPASTAPSGIEKVGDYVFSRFGAEIAVTVPEGVTEIGRYVFEGSAFNSVSFPSTLQKIGVYPFVGAKNLRTVNVAADNATFRSEGNCVIRRSDNKLVYGCVGSVIPDTVAAVGARSFYMCEDLTHIDIPASVTAIEEYAFYGTGIKSVCVPATVVTLARNAFFRVTVYTEFAMPPEGWQQCGIQDDGGYWAVFGCEFAEDGGARYLKRFYYDVNSSIGRNSGFIASVPGQTMFEEKDMAVQRSHLALPTRVGYTLAGWAIEEGGDIVFEASGDGEAFVRVLTSIQEVTPMYPVWTQNN